MCQRRSGDLSVDGHQAAATTGVPLLVQDQREDGIVVFIPAFPSSEIEIVADTCLKETTDSTACLQSRTDS